MKLVHNLDWFTSADTFSCTRFLLHSLSLWGERYLSLGSGTKLIVTDEQVVKPVVSVYPAASRAHLEGKSSLLCLASAMFPPLVRFSWKRQKENGQLEELPPAEGEQLELRESGRTAAILLVHQPENSSGSPGSFPVSVQGEAALSAVHSADSEESAVLLWTLSADEPQKQGTIHLLLTC
ncbi:uncharacterized protein LOC113134418 isoform X2 [Mastacembelus armatus]|uniref:uncharacterized protein LOC113134418 isoform X2 n=1 Tax=Mastacembelus armatus TaxID=205130 RepID=UPI000E453AB0|nr:uncharacterized protein LOC113134418 isoform X2 [Mastacembelus armatus]